MPRPDKLTAPGVLRVGIGLAALGRPAYITLGRTSDLAWRRSPEKLEQRTHEVLDAAWDAGVRYVDCARSYGYAERFVGSWLAEHPERRDDLVIGSKWGYEYVANWDEKADPQEVKDHSAEMFDRQWPQTLEALGGPPDVYDVHSMTPGDPALTDPPVLARMADLASSGVLVGFSTSGAQQGATIRQALELDDCPYRSVQATWNLLERSVGSALAEAQNAGWFVVIKEALANGRLTEHGDERVAEDLAMDDEQTPDAHAIAWALEQPFADVVLSGAVTVPQLLSNLAARKPTTRASDIASLAEPPEQYWAERASLPWR